MLQRISAALLMLTKEESSEKVHYLFNIFQEKDSDIIKKNSLKEMIDSLYFLLIYGLPSLAQSELLKESELEVLNQHKMGMTQRVSITYL
jgi:hypothetical protein